MQPLKFATYFTCGADARVCSGPLVRLADEGVGGSHCAEQPGGRPHKTR